VRDWVRQADLDWGVRSDGLTRTEREELTWLRRENRRLAEDEEILRLVQPHIRDLSTSNSQPGEDGSKPCSTSQRTTRRLRNDHHARITSRSTSVP
jgi:hypothetical protein